MSNVTLTEPVCQAWLESSSSQGGSDSRTALGAVGFKLGRSSECDLTVDSRRASREHAAIDFDGATYFIRDLGSTNGTFVNGSRVEESRLCDGDLIDIGDASYRFRMPPEQTVSNPAMTVAYNDSGGPGAAVELIGKVRQMQEMLLTRAVRVDLLHVRHADSGRLLGYEAIAEAASQTTAERLFAATDCEISHRLREMQWLLAAEQAVTAGEGEILFVGAAAVDVGSAHALESLQQCAETLGERRFALMIPDSAVSPTSEFRAFVDTLKRRAVAIGYQGFAGGPDEVLQLAGMAPDYLQISTSDVRRVTNGAADATAMAELVLAADEIGCQVIAAGVNDERTAEVCRKCGVHLICGKFNG